MLSEQICKRFEELDAQGKSIPTRVSGSFTYVDSEQFQRWASSAMYLVALVFGESSPHYKNFEVAYSKAGGYRSDLETLRGIFAASKSDYSGGYLFNVESRLSGEIFADFVVAAKTALHEGQKDVAAVLACAALEDALKRFARSKGLDVDGRVMQEVVNAIKAKGLVTGAQKSLLDVMPKIRDWAMHAEWTKIQPQDVASVIGFVEQFLLSAF